MFFGVGTAAKCAASRPETEKVWSFVRSSCGALEGVCSVSDAVGGSCPHHGKKVNSS